MGSGEAEREALRARIAEAHDIVLYRQYSESDAAHFLELHPVTLKRARLDGQVAFIRKGKRSLAYFGFQIVDFLIERIECPEPQKAASDRVSAKAETRNFAPSEAAKLAAQDEYILAQRSLKKPTKSR